MKPLFFAKILKQKVIMSERVRDIYLRYISTLEGQDIEITISKRKKNKTNDQNKLHWVRMTIIGKDLGYFKEDMHYVFKKQFLSDKMPILSRDQFIEYLQSIDKNLMTTTTLSTKEMVDFIEKIEHQAAELGIELPKLNNG